MVIERKIVVNKEIDAVWRILGKGFADVNKWATIVSHSEVHGNGKNGATCDYRTCNVKDLGVTKENILNYSDVDYTLSYDVAAAGFPRMVKAAASTWRLAPLSKSQTEVTLQFDMQITGILGSLMKPMMKMQMGGMAALTVADLKHFAETGRPSQQKTKALHKK